MNSLHQYLRLSITFLLLIGLLLAWQGWSGYKQFQQFHLALSERSVNSTAREIRLLVQSNRDLVRLFSEQESENLQLLLRNPEQEDKKLKIQNKIQRFFPNHLAFAIAGANGEILINNSNQLIGKTCRVELNQYIQNNFENNLIMVHKGPSKDSNHFDILSPIIEDGETIGVFFISFQLEQLRRVLLHGEVVGHHLLLLNRKEGEIIQAANGSYLGYENQPLSKVSNERPLHTIQIEDSIWQLIDLPANALFSAEFKRLLIQGLMIFAGVLGIAMIVLFAIRREEKKCGQFRGLVESIEEERRRIAMDMHDQVLSELSHVSRESKTLVNSSLSVPVSKVRLQNIETSLAGISQNIRSIINDLHPHYLDILGLEASLLDCLKNHYSSTDKIKWELKVDKNIDQRISKIERFNLYRIILEAIANIEKHANANFFSIHLIILENQLQLRVFDDGTGFERNNAIDSKGYGLQNIEMRARLLNATIQWNSPVKEKGTELSLTMPLNDG